MSEGIPLTQVADGQTVVVAAIMGGRGIHRRLAAMGIRPGSKVTKVSGRSSGPSVVLSGQTQSALGAGVCRKIIVEPA